VDNFVDNYNIFRLFFEEHKNYPQKILMVDFQNCQKCENIGVCSVWAIYPIFSGYTKISWDNFIFLWICGEICGYIFLPK